MTTTVMVVVGVLVLHHPDLHAGKGIEQRRPVARNRHVGNSTGGGHRRG